MESWVGRATSSRQDMQIGDGDTILLLLVQELPHLSQGMQHHAARACVSAGILAKRWSLTGGSAISIHGGQVISLGAFRSPDGQVWLTGCCFCYLLPSIQNSES